MISVAVAVLLGAAPPPAFDALIAEPSDRPIVIDVFTTWCKPCAVLEAYVFPEPSVAAALSKARFVQYDAERGEGIAVAERFGIASYPTILVLAPDGTKVGQVRAQEPSEFVAQLTPLLTIAAVKGPFTDEAVAKTDADARAIFVFALKTLNAMPPNQAKALALFEQAAKRDADGKRGVKGRALSLIASTKYRIETRALKLRTLLELARGDPSMTSTIDALGALTLYPEADAAELHKIGERIMQAFAVTKNALALNELVYAQLGVRDIAGALTTAKVLEPLATEAGLLDTVAEAYFQAGQKDRAIALEEKVLSISGEPDFKANLQRFKTEQPSPPPFSGLNPLDEFEGVRASPKFEMPAYFTESQQLEASLVDDCRRKAGKAKSAWLRLTLAGEKVTGAQAFDVEVPPALKKCLEESAKKKTVKELSSHSPWTMEIVFDRN